MAAEQHNCNKNKTLLKAGQQQTFDNIVEDIKLDPVKTNFFLNGLDGTGKAFWYTMFKFCFQAENKVIFCLASSNVAKLLLPSRKTSQSTFKILININNLRIWHIRE